MAANIYQSVKQAMQDLIAPQLESLKGEIGAVRGEIGAARGEIGTLRAEMRGEIATLRAELRGAMEGGFKAVNAEIRRLDDRLTLALDLRERIVAIEAKLAIERP